MDEAGIRAGGWWLQGNEKISLLHLKPCITAAMAARDTIPA